MIPDRYTSSFEGRKRLPGRQSSVSRKVQFPIWFGAIFVAVGVSVGYVAATHPEETHGGPDWIAWWFATTFCAFGIFFSWAGVRSLLSHAASKRATEPAMRDFNWNRRKNVASRFQTLQPMMSGAAVVTALMGCFAGMVFGRGENLFVCLIAVVFLGLPVFLWLRALEAAWAAFRFGPSKVLFDRFPYELDQPVNLHWMTPKNIGQMKHGVFILRCVHEYMEVVTRNHRERTHTIVHDEMWSAEWHIDQPREMKQGELVDLEFALPENAEPTSMNGEGPAVFWELDVSLHREGQDFKATYLIPIYRSTTAEVATNC